MSQMVVSPKIRGFICTNAHPEGCYKNIEKQVDIVKSQFPGVKPGGTALIIGSSTGYGLASRIVLGAGYGAHTIGVFYERLPEDTKTGSAGYYNSEAYHRITGSMGITAESINGDAFSNEIKEQVVASLKASNRKLDWVIYSLASPRRTHPLTGVTHQSVLKPVGEDYFCKTVDLNTEKVQDVTIQPANDKEVSDTIKVMGGEDWELWMDYLREQDVLNPEVKTIAYSYIGPKVTWQIYHQGTIGKAKDDLDQKARIINQKLSKSLGGNAWVSVNKAVVTQASAAIPVVPLYISLLFKIMEEKGIQEGCIEQIIRLFKTQFIGNNKPQVDELGRIRMDDWEMREDVQKEVVKLWPQINTENLKSISDYEGFKKGFRNLFGFEVDGVDYDQPVEVNRLIP